MLPVAVRIWPITHGLTMPLVMPILLMTAMPAAALLPGRWLAGTAQKIGNAAKINVAASERIARISKKLGNKCKMSYRMRWKIPLL